ncbi:MAG: GAF domain-containing protein [Armatimonadetes bacterium]|nr:GAF domain-containing protein [Armatimonadota bacterium]
MREPRDHGPAGIDAGRFAAAQGYEASGQATDSVGAACLQSPDPSCLISAGRIVTANLPLARLVGVHSPEALLGRPLASLVVPTERDAVARHLDAVVGLLHPVAPVTQTLLHENGAETPVDVSAAPFAVEGGPGAIVAIRDVGRRVLSERAALRANRYLTTIGECRRAVVRATDEGALLTDVCRLLAERGDYRGVRAGLVDGGPERPLLPVAHFGCAFCCLDDPSFTVDRCGPAAAALNAREPIYSWEMPRTPGGGTATELRRQCDSAVALPLEVDGEVIGAIMIDAEGSVPLEPGEGEMLAGLAKDVAYGIRALRSRVQQDKDREALRRSQSRLMALSQASQQLSRALDVGEVLRCLRNWVHDLMPCDGVTVSSYSQEDRVIRCLLAIIGDHEHDPATLPSLPLGAEGSSIQGDVIRSGEPILSNDYRARLKRPPPSCYLDDSGRIAQSDDQRFDEEGVPRSAMLVPMTIDGSVRGVIQVITLEENAYTAEHLGLLQALAAPAAVAFSNAELYRQAQEEIVERKRAEEQRAQMETQLLHAQKMDAMGRLAGGVAHDFNNLLTGMVHAIDLARDHVAADHGAREYLDALAQDAGRATSLTRQLLAFSRKQVTAPRHTDLNDIVGKTLAMLRRLIGPTIELTWSPSDQPATVLIDPAQFDQVVMNLVVNARDAVSGSGHIVLSTCAIEVTEAEARHDGRMSAGAYAVLACRDDGCGMDQATVQRLFEPFFTTKGIGHGTGLGLATVYGIVKQARGYVDIESQPGAGSVFRVMLPRVAGVEPAPKDQISIAEPVGGTPQQSGTILVCEDERSILATVRRFLTAAGYTVLPAPTPEEAVKLASEFAGTIDLLITDIMMPGQTGDELAQSLSEQRPGLRRIFMSGYTDDVVMERGVLAAGAEFLGKPFTRDDLLKAVRRSLSGPERNAPAG